MPAIYIPQSARRTERRRAASRARPGEFAREFIVATLQAIAVGVFVAGMAVSVLAFVEH